MDFVDDYDVFICGQTMVKQKQQKRRRQDQGVRKQNEEICVWADARALDIKPGARINQANTVLVNLSTLFCITRFDEEFVCFVDYLQMDGFDCIDTWMQWQTE